MLLLAQQTHILRGMVSPIRKIIFAAIATTGLIGALAYGLSILGDNQRLQSDLGAALNANQSQQTAMRLMAEEMARQNQAVVERDRRVRAARAQLKHTQQRLRDAEKNPQITVIQRECMDSDIPGPVLDVMRAAPHRPGSDPAGENLPGGYFLHGHGASAVRGPQLVGSGRLHQGPANAHPHAEPGPRGDSGVLQR